MQKNEGAAVHQACAACKHQRKKCPPDCVLAPFFPPEKNQHFQAVHKVFGVSNVSKIVKKLGTYTERCNAVGSLIWEAQCRQADPVLGSYGVYKNIVDEINLIRNQRLPMPAAVPESMMYKPDLIEWSKNNGNTLNYIHGNENFILEYGRSSHSINGLNHRYYLPDQYSRSNVKMDDTIWDGDGGP